MNIKILALAGLLMLASASRAQDEPLLRPSASLLFKQPELIRPGTCVMYREGGQGLVFTAPVYWLKGTVVATEIRSHRLERCPEVPGKTIEQYSREEFNRLANARPCVSRDDLAHVEEVGMVRLKVEDWETPWSRRAANNGRLWQGHFIDRSLVKGMQLEIEADLLGACEQ